MRCDRLEARILICNNAQASAASRSLRLLVSLARQARSVAASALALLRSTRVSALPLGQAENVEWVRSGRFDLGLHAMGVIYRSEIISVFRLGILNAHIGHLPGLRGRSVLEWSLVYGIDPCVSTFFVDEGIDSGPLIVDRYLPPSELVRGASSLAEAKDRMFGLDGFCYGRAIDRLLEGGEGFGNLPLGRRFYAMSDLSTASIVQD